MGAERPLVKDNSPDAAMFSEYDGIILGVGHNGLILQAYLGKAGLKVLTIERRGVAGGGLSTHEDPRYPGFLQNTHAFFQSAITAMPWYADLELERHGARYIEPELNPALITSDGRALEWWTDIAQPSNRSRALADAMLRHCAVGTTNSCRSSRHPWARGSLAPVAGGGAAPASVARRRRPAL